MKRVKFIKSLNIESANLMGRDELSYSTFNVTPVRDLLLETNEPIRDHRVAIHQVSQIIDGARCDDFIAYSEEVQKLLGMPFDLMKQQIDSLNGEIVSLKGVNRQISNTNRILNDTLNKFNDMSRWDRLKRVFN